MLFCHFKCTQFNAIKLLKMKWYTIQDIQNNQESLNFVLNVICHVKDADMIKIFTQLT